MSLFHEPSSPHLRPSLVDDLLGVPATASQHQLENQATTVVAWLVDRSPTLARIVLELFLADYTPNEGQIGARTQISLAKPGGGAVYPDLSICMGDRALQLLVEVKVSSEFHTYPEFGDRPQPDVYRLLWTSPSPSDARLRAVGTLTREGSDVAPDPARLIGRDVAWRELRDAIQTRLDADGVEADVRLVAESFVAAIDNRISPIAPSPTEEAVFFAEHQPTLNAVAAELGELLGAREAAKKIRGRAYLGWRIALPSCDGQPLFARLYLSPAGTRLNLPGAPHALIAAPERDPNGTLEPAASVAAEASGFARTKDLDGYWLHRRIWPLEGLIAPDVARQMADGFRSTGLLADAPGPGYDDSGAVLEYEGNIPLPADYWPKMTREDGTTIERPQPAPED